MLPETNRNKSPLTLLWSLALFCIALSLLEIATSVQIDDDLSDRTLRANSTAIKLIAPNNKSTTSSVEDAANSANSTDTDPTNGVAQFLHPLILTAMVKDPSCVGVDAWTNESDCSITIRTRAREYLIDVPGEHPANITIEYISKYVEPTDSYGYDLTVTDYIGYSTYDIDASELQMRGAWLGGNLAKNDTVKFECHFEPFRAYERFKYLNRWYSVGVDDSGFCISRFVETKPNGPPVLPTDSNNIEMSIMLPLRLVKQDSDDRAGHYKYSALAIKQVNGMSPQMVLFDEAGRLSVLFMQIGSTAERLRVQLTTYEDETEEPRRAAWSYPIGAIQLSDNTLKELTHFEPTWSPKTLLGTINELSDGLDRLRDHFDFSFVEAITTVDGALCWSNGLHLPTRPSVRCLGGRSATFLPGRILNNQKYTVYAMEIVEHKNNTYYHFITNKLNEETLEFEPKNTYWFCHLPGLVSAKHMLEAPSIPLTHKACKKTQVDRTAIDIVSYATENCHKLITFYEQVYQVNEPNEQITQSGNIIPLKLPFPVNAVTYQMNKFYFFLSSNALVVIDSKPKKVKGASDPMCNVLWLDFKRPHWYQSSELLRQFARDYGSELTVGLYRSGSRPNDFSKGPPVFVDHMDFSLGEWHPAIEKSPARIPLEVAIRGVHKEKSDASLMIMFGALCCVVAVLLGLILNFVVCGKSKTTR